MGNLPPCRWYKFLLCVPVAPKTVRQHSPIFSSLNHFSCYRCFPKASKSIDLQYFRLRRAAVYDLRVRQCHRIEQDGFRKHWLHYNCAMYPTQCYAHVVQAYTAQNIVLTWDDVNAATSMLRQCVHVYMHVIRSMHNEATVTLTQSTVTTSANDGGSQANRRSQNL